MLLCLSDTPRISGAVTDPGAVANSLAAFARYRIRVNDAVRSNDPGSIVARPDMAFAYVGIELDVECLTGPVLPSPAKLGSLRGAGEHFRQETSGHQRDNGHAHWPPIPAPEWVL
jgi:hypothetical protein